MPVATSNVTIDFTRIEERLLKYAERGLLEAAEYALKRAQHHAPVRKLFRGTTYTQRRGFRSPILRRVTFKSEGTGRDKGQQFKGHSNSLIPLFRARQANGRTAFLTGDFRAVSVDRRRPIRAKIVTRDPNVVRTPRQDPAADEIFINGRRALTARGKYEIRSGRANFRDPGSRTTRVGGRLRGELHLEGPFTRGGGRWYYVVSRTKDRGRLYGRDMEFGNRRTRPHPFLRPALHESRGPLRRFVREALRDGLRKR